MTGEDRRGGVCRTGISGKNRQRRREERTFSKYFRKSRSKLVLWVHRWNTTVPTPIVDKDLCQSAARRASQEAGLAKTVVSKREGKQDRHHENNTESWKPMGQYFHNLEGEMRYAILDWYLWIDDPQTWSWNKGVFKACNYKNSLTMRLSSGTVGHFLLQRKQSMALRWGPRATALAPGEWATL